MGFFLTVLKLLPAIAILIVLIVTAIHKRYELLENWITVLLVAGIAILVLGTILTFVGMSYHTNIWVFIKRVSCIAVVCSAVVVAVLLFIKAAADGDIISVLAGVGGALLIIYAICMTYIFFIKVLKTEYYYNDRQNDVTYSLMDGEYHVISINGKSDSVVLRSEIDGLIVKHIDDTVDNPYIKFLTLEPGNWIIYSQAFSSFPQLQSVVINDSYVGIGTFAFANCTQMKSVDLSGSDVTIGENAFDNCRQLESVVMNNSSAVIGQYAFSGCSRLESVDMSESLISIDLKAFYNCTRLKSVSMAGSTVTAKDSAFHCSSPQLEIDLGNGTLKLPENASVFKSEKIIFRTDGGTITHLVNGLTALYVGRNTSIQIGTYSVEGKKITSTIRDVYFDDKFDFSGSSFSHLLFSTALQTEQAYPFAQNYHLPASITRIPDSFFGDLCEESECTVYYAGTEQQWNALTISQVGNQNYFRNRVRVVFGAE